MFEYYMKVANFPSKQFCSKQNDQFQKKKIFVSFPSRQLNKFFILNDSFPNM